jgi:hypothetical protein
MEAMFTEQLWDSKVMEIRFSERRALQEAFEPLNGKLQDKTQLENLSLHLAQLVFGPRTTYTVE